MVGNILIDNTYITVNKEILYFDVLKIITLPWL